MRCSAECHTRGVVEGGKALVQIRTNNGVQWLAEEIYNLIAHEENPTLGLATGSSPIGVYARVAEMLRDNPVDVSRLDAFALDEYVGLPTGHPESYHEFIRTHVTEPWGLDPSRVQVPRSDLRIGGAPVPYYDVAISAAGGVDLQILGIGHNGHIGFNEPGAAFTLGTHIELLSESTREANARFFGSVDEVPKAAVTQGPANILTANRIVLLAFGEAKADAVYKALEGPVTEEVPASVLQNHPNVTFVLDAEAASRLSPEALANFSQTNS